MTSLLSRMAGESISLATRGIVSSDTATRECHAAVANMDPQDMVEVLRVAAEMSEYASIYS